MFEQQKLYCGGVWMFRQASCWVKSAIYVSIFLSLAVVVGCVSSEFPPIDVAVSESSSKKETSVPAEVADAPTNKPPEQVNKSEVPTEVQDFRFRAGDRIQLFIWRNPELSVNVTIRPDGKITAPLIDELVASHKTPKELAREIEKVLSAYIKSPVVTVMVGELGPSHSQQIRVIGAGIVPKGFPHQEGMTLLDVIIAMGGLTENAAGNRASIVREEGSRQVQFSVRLDDLIRRGDVSANMAMRPGDILVIPEARF